jgi:NADH-quinone oxidoreductase subunit H
MLRPVGLAVRMSRSFLVALLALAMAACATSRNVPELLTLIEVMPARVDVGDRVDVMGVDLPSSEVRGAKITLRGDFYRPGAPPARNQVVEIDTTQVSPDRVSFDMNEVVAEKIVGRGEDARHTTFRGTLEVSIPSSASPVPVFGTLRGTTTLDFYPRTPRRAILDERDADAKTALEFLGVELADPVATPKGLDGVTIARVAQGSPAEKAGVEPLDRIVAFEGVTVADASDVVPNGNERSAPLTIVRGDARLEKAVDVDGWHSDTTRDLIAPALVLGTLILLLLLLGTPPARVLSWLERRIERGAVRHRRDAGGAVARAAAFVSSVVQDRPGKPPSGALGLAAPFLVFVGVSATFAFVPWVELHRRAELDVGVLYLLSVTSFATMALVTGGHDAEAKWSPFRCLRAFARALACELPAALSIGAVVLSVGSLRLRDIALAQVGPAGRTLETGGWPWYFLAVKSPQLVLLFVLFFVTVLVEPSRPRALRGADDGSSSLPSLRRTAFFFAEWMNVFVMCALATAIFFGAWYVPGFPAGEHETNPMLAVLGTALYLVKSWTLVAIVMTKRVSLPRVRSDVLVGLGLRLGLPITIVAVGVTFLEAAYPPMPTVALMVSGVTLATATIVGLLFAASAFGGSRARARTTSNAIL